LLGALCAPCGCSGCDSELYWSEWHNDPPYCHDPCNSCGQWVGPSAGCGGCCEPACGCGNGCASCDGASGYAPPSGPMYSNGAEYAKAGAPKQPTVAQKPKWQPTRTAAPAHRIVQRAAPPAPIQTTGRPRVQSTQRW
jgi:hypothetical protein